MHFLVLTENDRVLGFRRIPKSQGTLMLPNRWPPPLNALCNDCVILEEGFESTEAEETKSRKAKMNKQCSFGFKALANRRYSR